MNVDSKQYRREAVLAGIAVMLLAGILGSLAIWMMRGELPDRIAAHWDADGSPDRFIDASTIIPQTLLIGILLPMVLVAIGFLIRRPHQLTLIGAGTAVFCSLLSFLSTRAQRVGQETYGDTAQTLAMWISLVCGIAVGVILHLVFRRRPLDEPVTAAPTGPRLEVGESARIAWSGHTPISWGVSIAALVGVVGVGAPMGIMLWNGNIAMGVTMAMLLVVLGLLYSATQASVMIDRHGVRVRGLRVIRWVTIPLDQITTAEVVEVDPRHFGGFGIRSTDDEVAYVTRGGPGLRISRNGLPPMIITLDGPDDALTVLNTLLARSAA